MALTVHENKNSADVTEHSFRIVTWLRDGISWPHLRAKRYVGKNLILIWSQYDLFIQSMDKRISTTNLA